MPLDRKNILAIWNSIPARVRKCDKRKLHYLIPAISAQNTVAKSTNSNDDEDDDFFEGFGSDFYDQFEDLGRNDRLHETIGEGFENWEQR